MFATGEYFHFIQFTFYRDLMENNWYAGTILRTTLLKHQIKNFQTNSIQTNFKLTP